MAVTIRDVAKAAGTSISTVSKVINRHYSISEATARARAAGDGRNELSPDGQRPEFCQRHDP